MGLGWLVEAHMCSLEVMVKAWLFTQGAVGKEKHFEERRDRFELRFRKIRLAAWWRTFWTRGRTGGELSNP